MKGKIDWFKMTTPGAQKEEPKSLGEFISQVKVQPGAKVYGK